ncbi:protein angel [Drosophila albomicans]|uniref:Protein angel n=1 Tax=Drosophila albomicans TaxID=7291 RepID=A0A6P8XG05_DROAB|nr:protein angel [Drosophila albomicans]
MSKSLLRSLKTRIQNTQRGLSIGQRRIAPKMEPRYDYNRKWTMPAAVKLKATTENQAAACGATTTFKLISYNILAQDLLMEHMHLYLDRPQELLTWHSRLQKLQREIIKLDADILCLQEMQHNHLPLLVQRLTASSGKRLEYVYKKKTGNRTDGCAIIYDSYKFKLLHQRAVELYDASVPLLDRDNVALLAKFRLKQSEEPKEVIVATTHLLFNPRRSDVRCAQVAKVLNELRHFATNSTTDKTTPVILTGDFNSEIESSPMYLAQAQGTEPSALNFKILDPGDFTASTFQDAWITVDYIMHSDAPHAKHKLQVLSVYLLPKIGTCANAGNIPNYYLGSDHYSLGAVFAIV